ncbi:hypothetical protein COCSUDRAFT_52434 [Coccomyxa subellipsoidea C-169]|uniref:Uncharacterized protein n=1 Tax=Coccomyxa subellipsoidea (strain C-169) TaxID=574566 RepID=I0Z7V1_COCSC|nr:hypothetical protein COCSUDRAFT_52434 [Coccomyxa subellipsoidea C-169]EIE26720.1 hypothetical protein COCSUDRAFT_52434 [Coccomyxa subellipsoidea C-169]|eukprot:XP_005651264.1 hypothetical protein COCSUDRAFT_52434 [Coccomyxa subellipsoidea C-169]
MASPVNGAEPPRERPRLKLKPRDEAAAQRATIERAASGKSNPFGAAKPRESILANRVGKKEEDILKEEVLKEKLALRLTPDQIEAKKALEAAVEEVKQDLEVEDDATKKEALQVELKDRESKLDGLMEQFEKMAVDRAKSGEIGVRPSERRRQVEEAQLAAGGFAGGRPDGYGGGRGFAGRGGYDYGNGGQRGGRGGGGGFGRYDSYQQAEGGGSYGSTYKETGSYDSYGQGGYTPAPSYGDNNGYGRGGGRGGRGGGRTDSAGLYDRFGGGYGAAPAEFGAAGAGGFDTAGEVEYQSPYARQDRF